MIGLLLKDFYTLRQYGKTLLVMLVFFVLLSAGMENPAMFFEGFFVLMSMMMTLYSFSYDTLAKWDRYALSLPVTRKEIVFSKYLLAAILTIGGALISYALSSLILQFKPVNDFNISDHLFATAIILSVAFLFAGIILPMIFKFGVEKSRLFLIIVFATPTAAVLVINQTGMPKPSDEAFLSFLKGVPVVALTVFLLSYFVSLKIVSSKEY